MSGLGGPYRVSSLVVYLQRAQCEPNVWKVKELVQVQPGFLAPNPVLLQTGSSRILKKFETMDLIEG